MKIITWNCNGAFRNKYEAITNYNADIYVIQECENPAESKHNGYLTWAENYLWIGDNKNKGLGIFARKNIILEKLKWQDTFKGYQVKHFLPCKVNNAFNLLAVWTHRNNSPNFGYIGQFWKYLQLNKDNFQDTIIAGDFNSNTIWDQWDRWWNHSDVVRELREIGIESVYHKITDEHQGKESQPTLFFQKRQTRPFHIDYILMSYNFIQNIQRFEVGKPPNWLPLSDHMPIFCEFGAK